MAKNYSSTTEVKINGETTTAYRINNCVNGNPRYVIHFLAFGNTYNEALSNSRKIGGTVYRAKWFGGGIIISSYNLQDDCNRL